MELLTELKTSGLDILTGKKLFTKEDFQQAIYIKEEWENLSPEEAQDLEHILLLMDNLYQKELSIKEYKRARLINYLTTKLISDY